MLPIDQALLQEDQKEALSRAYMKAVAARAGYVTARLDYDRLGIDMVIFARGSGTQMLNIQLKATTTLGVPKNGVYRFRLERHYYDLLRGKTGMPGILVVLDLPTRKTQWLSITCLGLLLRRRAYWLDLNGLDDSPNSHYVTVSIPQQNVMDVPALRQLMRRTQQGRVT